MAPQLSAMNGLLRLGEAWCSASAATSLPVPLSPLMKTVALEPATLSIVR